MLKSSLNVKMLSGSCNMSIVEQEKLEEQYNQLFGEMLDIKQANLITDSDGKKEFYNLFFETIRKSLDDIETYIKNQEYPANDFLIEFAQKTYKVSALYLLQNDELFRNTLLCVLNYNELGNGSKVVSFVDEIMDYFTLALMQKLLSYDGCEWVRHYEATVKRFSHLLY